MSLFLSARWVARNLAILMLLGAVAAYFHPPLFLVFKHSFLWFFAATMFAVGMVLDPGELGETLRSPGQIGLGLATQHHGDAITGFSGGSACAAAARNSTWIYNCCLCAWLRRNPVNIRQ